MPTDFTPKIALFRGSSFVDRAIQFRTWSVYSHAAILISSGNVLESYPGIGVRKRTLTAEDWREIDLFSVPEMTPEGWAKALEFGYSQIGCAYDWRGIARFVFRTNPQQSRAWWCSEFVVAICARGGVPLFRFDSPGGLPPDKASPGDIATSVRVAFDPPRAGSGRIVRAINHPMIITKK